VIREIVGAYLMIGAASSFAFLIMSCDGGLYDGPSHLQVIGGDDLQNSTFALMLACFPAWPICWAVYAYCRLRSF
jgi:hypothetical protein